MKLYMRVSGSRPRQSFLQWVFHSGVKLKFSHLEYENTVYDYQGAQLAFLGFDELTHFSYKQFFYLLSRVRSTSGVPGYVRATCNPDCDSWVRQFIAWWIGPDGFPIKERSGVLRWFTRQKDSLIWADSREYLIKKYGEHSLPMSVTFIPSSVHDNKILMDADPSYLAKLRNLSYVDRMRLEGGNWDITESAGNVFRREWFPVIDTIPGGWTGIVRFWDRAGTKVRIDEPGHDPDWTRGLKMYSYPNGTFLVADLRSIRDTPGNVEKMILAVAAQDSVGVRIVSQKDPGSAGVAEAENFIRRLVGYDVRTMTTSKDKLTRSKPVSAQAEFGNIMVLRSTWNDEFFKELESFPDGKHDDIVDTLSGAFNELVTGVSMFDTHHKLRG